TPPESGERPTGSFPDTPMPSTANTVIDGSAFADEIIDITGDSAKPAEVPVDIGEPTPRKRRGGLIFALVALLVVGVGVGVLVTRGKPSQDEPAADTTPTPAATTAAATTAAATTAA